MRLRPLHHVPVSFHFCRVSQRDRRPVSSTPSLDLVLEGDGQTFDAWTFSSCARGASDPRDRHRVAVGRGPPRWRSARQPYLGQPLNPRCHVRATSPERRVSQMNNTSLHASELFREDGRICAMSVKAHSRLSILNRGARMAEPAPFSLHLEVAPAKQLCESMNQSASKGRRELIHGSFLNTFWEALAAQLT